jgi:DNA-binding transcriptional regulator YiaG
VTGLASSRHNVANSPRAIFRAIRTRCDLRTQPPSEKVVVITGQECRRSLYERRNEWHGVLSMNALRELRRSADLGQRELAALLSVPVETLRTWDSGRRPVPITVMRRAVEAVANYTQKQKLLSLDQLARELGVHIRTLQAAARTGRLRFSPNVSAGALSRAAATDRLH